MRATPLRRVLIVGGGLAALRAVERLAERGFAGRVDVVGAEPHRPYRRPALSEGALTGALHPRDLRLHAPEPRLTRWLTGRRAVGLDRGAQRVELDDGRRLPYDGLVVATGVRPRTLPSFAGIDPRLVHHLRTVDDALRLRAASRGARHVLVVGGGLVGTEVACSLASHGVPATIIEPAPTLLASLVGPELGAALTQLHLRRGVDARVGAGIASVEPSARGLTATLSDGSRVEAGAAVVAVGSLPAVEWLDGAGLDLSNGLLCDPWLFAAGAEGDEIVAAGDCARWRNARFGGLAERTEQWVTTTLMARHAVDSLLDGRRAARPFTPVPWGWTEQWGVRVHMVGMPTVDAERRIFDGDPEALRGAFSLHDGGGRLVGGLAVDRPGATLRLTALLAETWPEPPGGAEVWEHALASEVHAAGRNLDAADDSIEDRRARPRSAEPTPRPIPADLATQP